MLFVFSVVICVITALMARKKGYSPVLWFPAAGIIGLLILAFLPFVNEKSNLPEEKRQSKKKTGNIIGGVISAFAIAILLIELVELVERIMA